MTIKRILYAIILLILGYLGYVAYTLFLSPTANLRSVYLIPKDAVFLVETQEPVENWDKISESEAWRHLQKNNYFSELTESVQKMDTIFHKKKKLFKFFGTRSLVFSIHMYQPKKYGIFYVVDLKKIAKLELLKSYFNTLLDDNFVLSKRQYHNHEIIELYDKATKETLHISFIQNQLIASYVHTLVEASIDQYLEPKIGRDLAFIEIKKQTGYDDMFRLYIQYDFIDEYVRYFSDAENNEVKMLSKALKFSGFNLDLKSNNTIVANGFTNISEDNIGYLRALQKSGTAKRNASKIAPKQTAMYMSFGFDSFKELYTNFNLLLKEDSKTYIDYKTNYDKIESILKINIEENFGSWIDDEICFLHIKPKTSKKRNDLALLIKTNDIENATENLQYVLKQIKKRTPVKFKSISYKNHDINFLSIKGFFKLFLNGLFERFDKPYFTIIEDYVIFSNDPSTLKGMIDDYVAKNTLNTSEDFLHFETYFKDKSSVFTYINTPILFKNMYAIADGKTKINMRKNRDFIICFPQMGFQLIPDDDLFKSKLIVNYQDAAIVKSKDQFKDDQFYGPKIRNNTSVRTNILAPKDIFEVIDIFPEDLNANEHISSYKDGTIYIKVDLKNGQKHGRYYEYYPNGEVKKKGRFRKDIQVGTWRYYNDKGELLEKKKF